MQTFARWHIWLGWAVAIPFLLWTISGLFMVVKPIEEVRGDHLRAETRAIDAAALTLPTFYKPVQSVTLTAQPDGPVWIVTEEGGGKYRYSAETGAAVPPVIEEEAKRLAESTYTGEGILEQITYFPAGSAPNDFGRNLAAWQAHYSDGTNLYVSDATGEVLALRTDWWRAYDFMWGLHIMDPQTRDDPHNPLLIGFSILGILTAILGSALLFRRRKAKMKKGETASRRPAPKSKP